MAHVCFLQHEPNLCVYTISSLAPARARHDRIETEQVIQEWDDARRDGQITTTDGRVTLHCIGCNNAAAVVGGPDVVLSELTRIHEILMQNYINSTR